MILNLLVFRYGTHNMQKGCKDRRLYFVIRITFFLFLMKHSQICFLRGFNLHTLLLVRNTTKKPLNGK
jgi:hypothetical protein